MKNWFLVLIFITTIGHAQSFQWLAVPEIDLTLNPGMVGYSNAVDLSGNTYVTGFKENPFPYSEIFGDYFFNKYNTNGGLEFSRTFTGRVAVYDIETDADGNVLMAIGYVNSMTIGDENFNTINQGIQPLLAKFDNAGNLVWHFTPVIEGSFEANFHAIAVDDSGNILIGYDDFQNSYIQKLSSNGESLMTIINQNVKLISSIDLDAQGNIYAAGSCAENTASFAGVSFPTDFTYNTWVAKYDANGVFQWAKYVEDITCSSPQVKANTPDQIYFSSALYGQFQFGGITADGPAGSVGGDFFLTRLDGSGNFLWLREVPSGNFGSVDPGNRNFLDVNANGEIVFAGSTRNTISWNDEIQTSAQQFGSDALVLKYNADGDILFAKTFGGASEDRVDGVSFEASSDVLVAGMARGTVAFDSFTHEAEGVTNYPFIAKISNTTLDNPENQTGSFYIWPNPVTDVIHFSGTETVSGEIFNLLGQRVISFETDANQTVNLEALPSGIYVIRTKGEVAIKFVKS